MILAWSPGLFGASSSASAFNFGGGGGFGQTQPASSAASLFGSAPAFGGFGQPQSSSAFGAPTTSNVFGQPAQQNQIVPAGYTGGEAKSLTILDASDPSQKIDF